MIDSRRRLLLAAAGGFALVTLGGCGFRLRGQLPMPFSSLYVNVDRRSEFGSALRRQLSSQGVTLVDTPAEADARLDILGNSRDREILTLTAAGKVREYELTQTLRYRVLDRKGEEVSAPAAISARRDYNFEDATVLAKEQEESLLYRDMQRDVIQQLMRRLAAIEM